MAVFAQSPAARACFQYPNNQQNQNNKLRRLIRANRQKTDRTNSDYSFSVKRINGPFAANFKRDPLPPVFRGNFTYYAAGTLTAGTLGVMGSEYQFRLNSCYDPDLTSSGRQPYAWDQIAPLYSQYLVDHCDMEITFYDPSEDGLAAVAAIHPSLGGATLAGLTYEVAAEKPMSVGFLIANTGSQKQTIRQRLDLCDVEGITKMQLVTNQSQYGALISGNPGLSPLLKLAVGSVRAAASGTISFEVRLTMRTQLFQRVVQSSS